MTTIQELSTAYAYDATAHDFRSWWDHHRALIAGMESAQWPAPDNRGKHIDWLEGEIIEIRERFAAGGIKMLELAEMFDCAESTIWRIVAGETHKDIGGPIRQPKRRWKPWDRHVA